MCNMLAANIILVGSSPTELLLALLASSLLRLPSFLSESRIGWVIKSRWQFRAISGTTLPMFNEDGKKEWATADSIIPARVFEIDAAKDSVIETTRGTVIAIPAHTFLTKEGKTVSVNVMLCIKEALDPLTIMNARLSTMSGDRLLETGGMFLLTPDRETIF